MEHVCRSALTFFVHSTLFFCIIISIEFVFIIIMPLCVVVLSFFSFARANLSDISLLADSPLIYARNSHTTSFASLSFLSLYVYLAFIFSFLPCCSSGFYVRHFFRCSSERSHFISFDETSAAFFFPKRANIKITKRE